MHRRCVVQLDVDVVVVVLACLVVRLALDRLVEVLQRPPRRDELQHRCFPPLQLMSSMPYLMLLLVELARLPGRSHLAVELERRWSGGADLE